MLVFFLKFSYRLLRDRLHSRNGGGSGGVDYFATASLINMGVRCTLVQRKDKSKSKSNSKGKDKDNNKDKVKGRDNAGGNGAMQMELEYMLRGRMDAALATELLQRLRREVWCTWISPLSPPPLSICLSPPCLLSHLCVFSPFTSLNFLARRRRPRPRLGHAASAPAEEGDERLGQRRGEARCWRRRQRHQRRR